MRADGRFPWSGPTAPAFVASRSARDSSQQRSSRTVLAVPAVKLGAVDLSSRTPLRAKLEFEGSAGETFREEAELAEERMLGQKSEQK